MRVDLAGVEHTWKLATVGKNLNDVQIIGEIVPAMIDGADLSTTTVAPQVSIKC